MRRFALLAILAALAAVASPGCRDRLSPDWGGTLDPDSFPAAVSAEARQFAVRILVAANGTAPVVLYVSTDASFASSTRYEDPPPSMDVPVAPGITVHARAARIDEGVETMPGVAVSAASHGLLPLQPSWSLPSLAPGDRMGYPVAGIGDANGDGFDDFAVSAFRTDVGGANSVGRVFVFDGGPAAPSQEPARTLDGEIGGANFGAGLAGAGDVNADGFADLVVGSPDYQSNPLFLGEGKAYLYLGGPSGIAATPVIENASGQRQAYLGRFVSGAGDVNGDGRGDVLVAAPGYDDEGDNLQDSGLVMLFLGADAGVESSPSWTCPGVEESDNFGWSLAQGGGDVENDGNDDVLAGGEHMQGTQESEGRFRVFRGNDTGMLNPVETWGSESNQQGAELGSSLSWADVNGDGFGDVIAGAHLWDGAAGQDAGAVFVHYGSALELENPASWMVEGGVSGAWLGESIAAADVDGDGNDEVLAGASHDAGTRGRVFLLDPELPGEVPLWAYEGAADAEYVGGSVANAGDVNADGREDVLVGTIGRTEITPAATTAVRLFLSMPPAGPQLLAGPGGSAESPLAAATLAHPDGAAAITGCEIDWGDGDSTPLAPCTEADLRALQHTYDGTGVYTIRVTATDHFGLTGQSVTAVGVP